jgi:hypothetical protein
MSLRFRDATLDDVAVIAGLQNAAAGALTARYGPGPWSSLVTERNVAFGQRNARVRVEREGKRIVTVLRLATKKPSLALLDATKVAREWPADAIRLDAYDAPAGAGAFYARCGFSERGRVVYKGNPLVYYERVVASVPGNP